MMAHLANAKKDTPTKRALVKTAHQRLKMLLYLKREDVQRYTQLIQRLAINPLKNYV
jgi:ribosomal protein S15